MKVEIVVLSSLPRPEDSLGKRQNDAEARIVIAIYTISHVCVCSKEKDIVPNIQPHFVEPGKVSSTW